EVQSRTRELTETLRYQTATSDVLNVISRAPSQVQPVFETIVATTAHLCEADYAFLFMRKTDGDYHFQVGHLAEPELQGWLQAHPGSRGRGWTTGGAAMEGHTIDIPDVLADPEYALGEWIKLSNTRAYLGVPLLRDGEPIGVITSVRKRAEPFTEPQIQLVT